MAYREPIDLDTPISKLDGYGDDIISMVARINVDWDKLTGNPQKIADKYKEIIETVPEVYRIEVEQGKPIKVYYYPSKDELKQLSR